MELSQKDILVRVFPFGADLQLEVSVDQVVEVRMVIAHADERRVLDLLKTSEGRRWRAARKILRRSLGGQAGMIAHGFAAPPRPRRKTVDQALASGELRKGDDIERCPGCGHNFYDDHPVRDNLCHWCVAEQDQAAA